MIRSIAMHNFVHFHHEQRLVFEEGTNFIIGGNSTGKTAVLELIRRCYSNNMNTSTTSVLNEEELAYAICHFTIPEHYPLIDLSEQPKEIVTCIFIKKNTKTEIEADLNKVSNTKSSQIKNNGNDCDYYKVICSISTDDSIMTFVKKFEGQYGCTTKYLEQHIIDCKQIKTGKSVLEKVKSYGTRDNIAEFFKIIANNLEFIKSTDTLKEISAMNALYEFLEKGYVGILPMRSIGPLQWTNSELNTHDHRKKNYREAYERAEILKHLLDNDKVNKEKEEKFHRHIVHPYQFSKSDGNILVTNRERGTEVLKPLLKTPEGVLEAKQLTLILAHKEYSTITYEEPDRGMHPHMIKKMRDLILKHVSGKTVLIISHNPTIIDNWAMSRTFICSKHVFGDEISHSVCKVPGESVLNRFSRIDEMRSLLFSSRILFVEGITDKIIMDAIFCLLINGDKDIRHEKQITTEQKHFLLSIDIREMSGKDEGYKKEEFCEKLGKEIFLLFDSDQKKKSEKGNVYIWQKGAIEQRFLDVIDNADEASVCACNTIFRKDLKKKAHNYNTIDKYIIRLTEIKKLKEELTKKLSKKYQSKNKKELISLEEQNFDAKVKIERRIKEKQLFQKAEPEEIVNIARTMINYSSEVEKFIRFLMEKNLESKL
ncbi:Hypothetical predicted protein [Mytilus galloprovincialis]|uniref:Rad50/SbcC-type AAA domain-containing protein n=1 Tax=Mytilus galloprovincialis TaxID=29158 RepID=A0A8B6C6U2_MYTGA|nr:Hypothetical predicted protein [Mytilus galloprovincialis]